jgi:hypothetical protein
MNDFNFNIRHDSDLKVQDNFQDKQFTPITSVRPYPSIVMRANLSVMSSVALAASGEIAVEKKEKYTKLSDKLIAQMRQENIRYERDAI